ncbi:MAG: cyclic nucleotide-binding domain-containing protein, partial [Candidatus Riflebacteria bacterium]|nr:cyclic nucleotide-binding domain-containing protein [Candidatus Riflebacteria bacterium]
MRYLELGVELVVPRGQKVFEIGSPTSDAGVFFVISGKVQLERSFDDGHDLVYCSQAGELFGIVETFVNGRRLVAARALEDSRLYAWSGPAFERAISIYIELAQLTLQVLS